VWGALGGETEGGWRRRVDVRESGRAADTGEEGGEEDCVECVVREATELGCVS